LNAGDFLSGAVKEDSGARARIDRASGFRKSGASLTVAGSVAAARFHVSVRQHRRANNLIGTAAHALLTGVEVVGVTTASAEQEVLALACSAVVVPTGETGAAHTDLWCQFAHIHWFFAFILALLQRLEIVLVAVAAAVQELLTRLGRIVVKVAREERTAMADLGRETTTVGALELVTVGVDEGYTALIARVGHADGVRVIWASGVDALVAAHHRLNASVAADGT